MDVSGCLNGSIATSVTGILSYPAMVSRIPSISKRHEEFLERVKAKYPHQFSEFMKTLDPLKKKSGAQEDSGKQLSSTRKATWDVSSLFELFVLAFEAGAVLDGNGKYTGTTELVTTILFLSSLNNNSRLNGLKITHVKDKLIRMHQNACSFDHSHRSICYEIPQLITAAQSYFEARYMNQKTFPDDVSLLVQAAVYLQPALRDDIVCMNSTNM